MVQTEDQYVFIHEALLEAVMAGYTEIPCRSLHHHIQQLMQTEPGKFQLSQSLMNNDSLVTVQCL